MYSNEGQNNVMPLEAQERLAEMVSDLLVGRDQSQLADSIGCSQPTISAWMQKRAKEWPKLGHMMALAHLKGLNLDELVQYLKEGKEPEIIPWEIIINRFREYPLPPALVPDVMDALSHATRLAS